MLVSFQKIVLTIAIIIFILLMIFIASVLHNNKYGIAFPPTISDCPDYWLYNQESEDLEERNDGSQTNQRCYNIQNLGESSCSKTMDFTGDFWKGSTGLCNKYKWAKSCDLTWDGITSNTTLCN
jgi:hypothetical protein